MLLGPLLQLKVPLVYFINGQKGGLDCSPLYFFFLIIFSRCVLLVLTKAVITLIFQQLWVLEFGRDFSLESLVELGLSLQIGLLVLRK